MANIGHNPKIVSESISHKDRKALTLLQLFTNQSNSQQFDYSNFIFDGKEWVTWFKVNYDNYKNVEKEFEEMLKGVES